MIISRHDDPALQPWHENLSKRQVKAPKIYFRDSGLLHTLLDIQDMHTLMGNPRLGASTLLDIQDMHTLMGNPRLGASWEGFAMEQVLQLTRPAESYFWATHSGAELDLFFIKNGKRIGVEFKFNEAPKISKSMRVALHDLSLSHLWVVYPGRHSYPVAEDITVLPLENSSEIIKA
ncbi:MAG: DUF4143 domain-containing protein [Deltaproteobacteria bacterium]|nr:DUF4143 domain-containing protein [Deltaproteobacteria bacterium]